MNFRNISYDVGINEILIEYLSHFIIAIFRTGLLQDRLQRNDRRNFNIRIRQDLSRRCSRALTDYEFSTDLVVLSEYYGNDILVMTR